MSVPEVSLRPMVNDIENLAAMITEFAAGHGMTVVPAVPGTEADRAVFIDDGILDLSVFLELARKLGDGALYLRTETFGLDPETGRPEDVPTHLARYKGQAGELRVAFASAGHGLLHFWDHTAPWYREWLDSQETGLLGESGEDIRAAAEEQSRLADEVAEVILADRELRASSSPYARRRRAQELIPEGTERHVGWDAVARAMELAQQQSSQTHRAIWDQLDEVAAEFLASPGWQQSASSAGRKKAAEQFLTSRADGFFPPPDLREELYARARELSKSRNSSGLFLSPRTSRAV